MAGSEASRPGDASVTPGAAGALPEHRPWSETMVSLRHDFLVCMATRHPCAFDSRADGTIRPPAIVPNGLESVRTVAAQRLEERQTVWLVSRPGGSTRLEDPPRPSPDSALYRDFHHPEFPVQLPASLRARYPGPQLRRARPRFGKHARESAGSTARDFERLHHHRGQP